MCVGRRGCSTACSKLLTTLHHAYFALLPRIYDIFTPVPATGCTGTPGAFTTHAVNRISPALLNEPASPWEQNHFGKLVSALLRARYSPPFYLINSCRGNQRGCSSTRSAIPRNNSLFHFPPSFFSLSLFFFPPSSSCGVNRAFGMREIYRVFFFFFITSRVSPLFLFSPSSVSLFPFDCFRGIQSMTFRFYLRSKFDTLVETLFQFVVLDYYISLANLLERTCQIIFYCFI